MFLHKDEEEMLRAIAREMGIPEDEYLKFMTSDVEPPEDQKPQWLKDLDKEAEEAWESYSASPEGRARIDLHNAQVDALVAGLEMIKKRPSG